MADVWITGEDGPSWDVSIPTEGSLSGTYDGGKIFGKTWTDSWQR